MMHATAGRSRAMPIPQSALTSESTPEIEGGSDVVASLSRIPVDAPIRRKCAACDKDEKHGMDVSPKLDVGDVDHPAEREADAIADRVMAGGAAAPASEGAGPASIRAKANPGGANGAGTMRTSATQSGAVSALGSGEAMSASDRSFFEPRLGQDLSHVRMHRGPAAETAAQSIGARAFTIGSNIAFGKGEYGTDHAARHLIAHELAHVQQNSLRGDGGTVRMAKLDIVDANFVGPLQTNERRAAASCQIDCDGKNIGKLHAMPMFHHTSRGAPLAKSSGSDGVGAMLHFIRSGAIPKESSCSSCKSWEIIQVLNTNSSAHPGGRQSYVDNANTKNNPFYTQVYLSGRGLHKIPRNYVDAGDQVDTTVSLYDRPFRSDAYLAGNPIAGDMFWNAEACVTCRKAGTSKKGDPDRILGCVKYGFTRAWLSPSNSYDDAVIVGPTCSGNPSKHFQDTLKKDPTTSSYRFTV